MRRFVCAAVVAVCSVSIALAADWRVVITKVDADGKTISFKKLPMEKGGELGEEMTAKLTATAKIYKGKFNPETKKMEKTDATVELAAYAEQVAKGGKGGKGKKKGGGVAIITTDDDGKTVSQVIIGGKGGGKKKKDAN
jgi:hypothetical protein